MMNKIKILANIFSKITVCVLLASAIYITVMCPDQCQDSLADSAGFRCMLHPDFDVPG